MSVGTWFLVCGLTASALPVSGLAADKSAEEKAPLSTPEKSGAGATNAAPASEYPVIVCLERRGQIIAVKAGPKGPLYSVKSTDGKVLFENLSAEQLRAQAPAVHDFLKTAMARAGEKSGGFLDARIDVTRR